MAKKPILVVMAAGMGSRYGGLKQIDPVGPSGEAIIDYSLYDARRAGFETVVFIIKHEIEQAFKEAVGARAQRAGFEVRSVTQTRLLFSSVTQRRRLTLPLALTVLPSKKPTMDQA